MAASASIVLFKGKKFKGDKYQVYLQVSINRKNKYFNIGNNLKCTIEQWNNDKRQFEKNFPNYKVANRNLLLAVGEANKILIDLEERKPNFTHEDFIPKFTKRDSKLMLFQYMDKIILRLKRAGKIGNAMTYETAKRVFSKFLNNDDVELTSITKKQLQQFVEYCQGNDLRPNTISNYLRTIRAVYNRAKKEEDFSYYPFENFNWKQLKTQTEKRAISKEDMIKIIDFQSEPGTALFDAQQMFTFMYLCYGLNFADLAKITDDSIIHTDGITILRYNRSKGGKLYEIPLNEVAAQILNYYRNIKETKYIFPILHEHIHITPEQQKTRIKTALKKFNKEIKILAEKLEIKAKVTSYTTRHSFASVLAKEGADPISIGDMLGHSDLKTTLIYLKELDYQTKIETAKKLLN